jgi:hypothetical protein
MTKTVMAKADEILATMGISDSVPLSEASTESLHSVGKKYNEDLPQIDDTQRSALLEACGAVDSDKTEINDTDDNGSNSVSKAEEEVSIKFKPARRLVKAKPNAKPTSENPVVIVADNKNPKPSKPKKKGRCWKGYEPTPGKKAYSDNSCRPISEAKSPAWQRKEGKNPKGGLNAKGVASYRAKNPGSKLKTAVTTKPSKLKKGSKSAGRRASFCARMGGMKKKNTSSKTASDPDSRINKSLRKWNCNESMLSIALEEMTSVGSIGVNMAGAQSDPMKPKARKKKKKSRKGNKATNKFLNNTFKQLQ